jgi:small neutral amino acid transporter SnatA (MarC family)
MDGTSITAAGVIDTFLVLLIGVGPKLALVPYVEITAALDAATKRRVQRTMMITAGTAALFLLALGELLRALLHFSVASLSIAGGVILLIQAVSMVLRPPGGDKVIADRDPLQLARFPLAVPYLLNPVGIVGLVTISAEATSVSVLAVAIAILLLVLLIDVAVFRWANQVSAKLDESRMLVTEKVFGFLIAAIAVQLILDGLSTAGVIPHLKH